MPTTITATSWAPPSNDGEYSLTSANNITDGSSVNLTDGSGVIITDGDTTFTQLPTTAWAQNDGS